MPLWAWIAIFLFLWSVIGYFVAAEFMDSWEKCTMWSRKILFAILFGPFLWAVGLIIILILILEPILKRVAKAGHRFLDW